MQIAIAKSLHVPQLILQPIFNQYTCTLYIVKVHPGVATLQAYVCTCASDVFECMSVGMFIHMYCRPACTCACLYVYMYVCRPMYVSGCDYSHVHVCLNVCRLVRMCIFMPIC